MHLYGDSELAVVMTIGTYTMYDYLYKGVTKKGMSCINFGKKTIVRMISCFLNNKKHDTQGAEWTKRYEQRKYRK